MADCKIKENDITIFTIGIINFSTNLGRCTVEIHTSDSNIAHFHIKNNDIDIKVNIFNSNYFDSNYKFNEIELKELNEFLNSTSTNIGYERFEETNWNRLVQSWSFENDCYSDYVEKENLYSYSIPNYLEMR